MEVEPTRRKATGYCFPDTAVNTLLKLIAGSHIVSRGVCRYGNENNYAGFSQQALHLSTTIVLGIAVFVVVNKLLLQDSPAELTQNNWSDFHMIQLKSHEGQPENGSRCKKFCWLH